MLGITIIENDHLQNLLNTAAEKLEKAGENFAYRNNFGITIFQLFPIENSFELGISKEAYSLGPVGNYASALIAFLTGKAEHGEQIHTEGVNTGSSQVKFTKLAQHHNFWFSSICKQLDALLSGDPSAVNAIVYPIAKHTLKEKAHKPCPTYVQYQFRQNTNALSVVINFRAQHLYMLAFNVQLWAFELLQLCGKFNLRLGSVLLNCTNHHVLIGQKPKAVCGAEKSWIVFPNTERLLSDAITKYYAQFMSY